MAIKDQCLKCKWYLELSDRCNAHKSTPIYDHRSCMDYVKTGGIDLAKHDSNQPPVPSNVTPQKPASAPNPKPKTSSKPPKQFDTKTIRTLLGVICYVTAFVACCFLAFGVGMPAAMGIVLSLVPFTLFYVTFKKIKKLPIRIIYLLLSIVLLFFSISKAEYRKENREEFDFSLAKKSDTEQAYQNYISDFPESPYLQECRDSIAAKRLAEIIHSYYYSLSDHKDFIESCESEEIKTRAIHALENVYPSAMKSADSSKEAYMEYYCTVYPEGPHAEEFKAEMYEKLELNAYYHAIDILTIDALNNYLKEYPDGQHANSVKGQIEVLREAAENAKYANNSLSTGSQPYANYYGRNGGGNCAVIVDASGSTDVVVIVKHNNSDGRVAGHAYIRRGSSYTIHLSPGTYQVFFYYGNGWNPNKKLSNGLTGGFTSSEQYGKDNPINLSYSYSGDYIYYDQMQYSLQSVVGGNFSMKGSNANDVF